MIPEGVDEALQIQAGFCRDLGSPLYATLLDRAREDLAAGGIIAEVFDGWIGNPFPDALPLRLLGAVHRIVLEGRAPELAAHYPSAGGSPHFSATWDAFREVVRANLDEVRLRLARQVQTNEVSRCAALLGGFLHVAGETQLPLRVLEIGSSAGLNLLWERFRYDGTRERYWGSPHSPVVVTCNWHGVPAHLDASVSVVERRGCDLTPVDVRDGAQVRMLESFIWPEQLDRLAQLRAAVALARENSPSPDRQSAGAWLSHHLDRPRRGCATIVFHSSMWWYVGAEERDAITRLFDEAGARATRDAPIAWLRMEPRQDPTLDVWLQLWPGGREVLLGRAHPHGREVWWSALD